jgi:hypothetical protein
MTRGHGRAESRTVKLPALRAGRQRPPTLHQEKNDHCNSMIHRVPSDETIAAREQGCRAHAANPIMMAGKMMWELMTNAGVISETSPHLNRICQVAPSSGRAAL